MSHIASIAVETSPGELIDKITILEIKAARIADADKLANIRRELDALSATRDSCIPPSGRLDELTDALRSVNGKRWDIEDDIRDCERAKDFGETFVGLARAVYFTNDERAALKRAINDLLGAEIVEEKSYAAY